MSKKKVSQNIENRINELLEQYDAAKETNNNDKIVDILGKIEILLNQLEENTYHVDSNYLQ